MRRAEFLMLLLCCPLGRDLPVLNRREYRRLADLMLEHQSMLDDRPMSISLLQDIGCRLQEAEKIYRLLETEREGWLYLQRRPAVTPVCRLSSYFPSTLRRLEECPAALFCLGDIGILKLPRISLVGNRNLTGRGELFALQAGRWAAKHQYVLVSGGARGADTVAMNACLEAGGKVISVLPDRLPTLPQENILYISDEGYDMDFTTARALRRNHYIHAMGERTYVAQCLECKGGTWSGAKDNLHRRLSPLFVNMDNSEGSRELLAMGAYPAEFPTKRFSFLRSPRFSMEVAEETVFDVRDLTELPAKDFVNYFVRENLENLIPMLIEE